MIETEYSQPGGGARRQAKSTNGGDAALFGSTARSLALPAARGVGETESAVAKLT